MINLDVKGYCEECPHFEAETKKLGRWNESGRAVVDSVVTCKNKDACEYAISHCFGVDKSEK